MNEKNQSGFTARRWGLSPRRWHGFLRIGAGAVGTAVGELCFNTAMTGYRDSDRSFICRTGDSVHVPHSMWRKSEDHEDQALTHAPLLELYFATRLRRLQWRANDHFDLLIKKNIIGLSGVDTRALTPYTREGEQKCAIQHAPDGKIDRSTDSAARAWEV